MSVNSLLLKLNYNKAISISTSPYQILDIIEHVLCYQDEYMPNLQTISQNLNLNLSITQRLYSKFTN
jgi:hypothetical protein